MYLFVCFILLVSLDGLKADNGTTNKATVLATNDTEMTSFTKTTGTISKTTVLTTNATETTSNVMKTTPISTAKSTTSFTTTTQSTDNFLFNLKNQKEMQLWYMIALLLLICLLLLVISTCLACKRCRGTRNNYPVVEKSSTRRNSVNGGPSETDVMLKDHSSVKVEIETSPDEPQEPVEVGRATAEVGNEVSGEENKNSASDTGETAPTQEVDQSGKTDLKMENLEKAE